MTTIFLTGASGFVGSRLARLLKDRGHDVHCLVRRGDPAERLASDVERIEGELGELPAWQSEIDRVKPEVCIHLAWTAEPGKYLAAPENVDFVHASAKLAFHLAERGCRRFVGIGTCFEYDVDAGYLSEQTPLRPRHMYSAAKVSLHLLLEQIAALTGMSVAWARLFYLYGPGEDPRRLVASLIRGLLRGEPVAVSPGAQVRDFLHVDDVAAALANVAEGELTGPVNIGSGVPVTVAELSRTVGRLVGKAELVRLGARPYAPNDPMFVCADPRRLMGTGWSPKWALEAGLEDTIAWWREQERA
jgi:nucleoside-diphosphate-sugar epimerase